MLEEVLKQLQHARDFLGQAQEAAPNSSDLWKEIGKLYDEVDDLHTMIDSKEVDESGKFIG